MPFLDIARVRGSLPRHLRCNIFEVPMAKAVTIKVKLVSSADTGFYYVTKKNSRTMTEKLTKKKYDPVAKKHVEFREAKIKCRLGSRLSCGAPAGAFRFFSDGAASG